MMVDKAGFDRRRDVIGPGYGQLEPDDPNPLGFPGVERIREVGNERLDGVRQAARRDDTTAKRIELRLDYRHLTPLP